MKEENTQDNFDWRNNSIDLVKMIAAYSVAAVHWAKIGVQENPEKTMIILRQTFLAIPSVVVFFIICGYLAAASLERYGKKEYIISRFIRIYPPLWISVVVNGVVLFFLWRENIDGSFVVGIVAELLGIAYTPTCLKHLPTGSMNGAMWTIMVQMQFYIFIAFIYPFLKRLKTKQWPYVLIVALSINIFFSVLPSNTILAKILERSILPYLVWFLFGVFAFIYREYIVPKCKRLCVPCIMFLIIYIVLGKPLNNIGYYSDIMTSILAMPITIGLIYLPGKNRIKNEYSFSIFLYHWIILNVFSAFGMYHSLGVIDGLAVYLVAVTIFSYLMNKTTKVMLHRLRISRLD